MSVLTDWIWPLSDETQITALRVVWLALGWELIAAPSARRFHAVVINLFTDDDPDLAAVMTSLTAFALVAQWYGGTAILVELVMHLAWRTE
jgi:Na+-driven multidrug efflux pump